MYISNPLKNGHHVGGGILSPSTKEEETAYFTNMEMCKHNKTQLKMINTTARWVKFDDTRLIYEWDRL